MTIDVDSRTVDMSTNGTMISSSPISLFESTEPEIGLSPTTTRFSSSKVTPWNNPDSVISYWTLLAVQRIMCCYVHNIFIVFGVPGNILSCIVFYRQGLRDRMNLCLFSLALSDMLFVVMVCSTGPVCVAGYILSQPDVFWVATLTYYQSGMFRMTMYWSGCLTMVIAVERCICVCWPMKAATLLTTRTMAAIIIGLAVVLELCCLAYPLKHNVSTVSNVTNNLTYRVLTDTELYLSYGQIFNFVINVINMTVIPFTTFTVVGVCTLVTVVKLRKAMAWRDNTSRRGNSRNNNNSSSNNNNNNNNKSHSALTARQVALVKVLVTVCVIYVVTSSASVAIGVTRVLVNGFSTNGKYFNIYLLASGLNIELSLINSSVNFYVYASQSSRFRMELWRFVCLGKCCNKAKFGQSRNSIYVLPEFPSRMRSCSR